MSHGRRIYIHQHSFRYLALQSNEVAAEVLAALAAVKAGRLVFHHLVDAGAELGLLSADVASNARRLIRTNLYSRMTTLLRSTGYRSRYPPAFHAFSPVLDETESVVASCAESGYMTYATSAKAAERMYADSVSLAQLSRAAARGEGPADLTILRGSVMAKIDAAVGHGPHKGLHYGRTLKAASVMTGDLRDAESGAIQDVLVTTRYVIDQVRIKADVHTDRLFVDCANAVERALTKYRRSLL